MPAPADRLNENDPQTWRRPKKSHHTPSTSKRHIISNTFKKECDDSAGAARTSSRVSSVHKGGGEGGYTRSPSGWNFSTRRHHRIGAGQEDMDFSRHPKKPPPRTIRSAPPNLSLTSMRHPDLGVIVVISLCPPTRGLEEERWYTGTGTTTSQPCSRELPPPRVIELADRTR
jgi:hypothetical protein